MNIQALVEIYFKSTVRPIRILPLKGDASSRSYYRIELPRGTIPESMVLMELPGDPLASDEMTDNKAPLELPFLNIARYLREGGLRVPRVYLDAAEQGALLLEDLGDTLLFDKVKDAALAEQRAWYEAAVNLLVTMHRQMAPIPDGCLAGSRSFGRDLLRWELDHYREWGLEELRGSPLQATLRSRLDAAFDALAERISSLPNGFVHRDYQSRNLMVIGEVADKRNLAIIDFQDAFLGPRVYDLVALLNDSYVDLPSELQKELLCNYAAGMEIDCEELLVEFHLVTVQRKLKDGGRFVFIDRVKNNPAFLPFVENSFRKVKVSLDILPELFELREILNEMAPVFSNGS